MLTQQKQIESKLVENGWITINKNKNPSEWWADEQRLIESKWTPNGLQIYLTFLVDPQWDDHRKKGQGVWSVGTSLVKPTSRFDAEGEPMFPIKSK